MWCIFSYIYFLLYNDNVNVGGSYSRIMKVNFKSDSEQFLYN